VQMEQMAPSMVLADNETPHTGWLVESNLEVVDAGSPAWRAVPVPFGQGASHVRIHVRVKDLDHHYARLDSKDASKGAANGDVIYEFDVAGGSHLSGLHGQMYAPGVGYAAPFDYKNAAERVYIALSTDPYRYGDRSALSVH